MGRGQANTKKTFDRNLTNVPTTQKRVVKLTTCAPTTSSSGETSSHTTAASLRCGSNRSTRQKQSDGKRKQQESGKQYGRGQEKVSQNSAEPIRTDEQLAKLAGVSRDTIRKVKVIETEAAKGNQTAIDAREAVKSGEKQPTVGFWVTPFTEEPPKSHAT